ncbi:MAG: STAS domain-containing protein [bacterium]|nr:STAS domain-containing protein [bacterium]
MTDTAENDFRIDREGDTVIVRIFAQELTMFHVPEVRADVMSVVQENPARILFDFTPTSFIDSSAIALLFKVSQQISQSGARMGVCGLRPSLLQVLQTVVKRGGIEFYESVDAALAAGD